MIIYHITSQQDWEAAQSGGVYRADSLVSEGFIHCSKGEQLQCTANTYYPGRKDLVLLKIDMPRLSSEVRFENTSGGTELFPHIYGPLNTEAVTSAKPFAPGPDGRFSFAEDDL